MCEPGAGKLLPSISCTRRKAALPAAAERARNTTTSSPGTRCTGSMRKLDKKSALGGESTPGPALIVVVPRNACPFGRRPSLFLLISSAAATRTRFFDAASDFSDDDDEDDEDAVGTVGAVDGASLHPLSAVQPCIWAFPNPASKHRQDWVATSRSGELEGPGERRSEGCQNLRWCSGFVR